MMDSDAEAAASKSKSPARTIQPAKTIQPQPKPAEQPKPYFEPPKPADSPQSSQQTSKPCVAEFDLYLKSIKTPAELTFNLNRFKTCRDHERKLCAQKLMAFAIDEPTKIENFAKIALRVLQTHHIAAGIEKTFIIHLQDVCDDRMKIFQKEHKNWLEIESLGMFIGHMYVLEVQKTYLMNQWLSETTKLAAINDLALVMLFKVFRLVHEKMQKKDRAKYRLNLVELRQYKMDKRVPTIYVKWLDGMMDDSSEERPGSSRQSRSHSVASNASSCASSASRVAQREMAVSTGAVKKIL
jgi:hypothetical protein